MTEAISATPLVNVGPIKFGMDRAAARKAAGGDFKEFKKTPFSKTTSDDFGAFHVYYDAEDKVEAIEIFEGDIEIGGKKIFPASLKQAEKIIPPLKEDEYGAIAADVSIGLTVEDGEVTAILFGTKGYYSE